MVFFNSLEHFNWQHTLLNMLCFFVVGLYLKRKKGTLKFFLFALAMIFFTSLAISANNGETNWRGFSGVNFGFYFYIIVDYAFSAIGKRNKKHSNLFERRFDFISSTAVLALIYLAMLFNGGTTSF